ncbi:phosphoadenosine phosphosulfate reductase family protein [Vibrio sp. PNB22_3_1]
MGHDQQLNVVDADWHAQRMEEITHMERVIDKYIPNWTYELPNERFSFAGMSGGVDSTTMIAVMLIKHGKQLLKNGFELVFCDTGNEPPEAIELLNKIEEVFDISIVRLQDATLYGKLDENGGYIPSIRKRWCTTDLKIVPYNRYLKDRIAKNERVNTFVGINYSERERAGDFGVPNVDGFYPFVDQKVTRDQITSIGAELGLMNRSYAHGRSRSGCQACFMMSFPELVSYYLESPQAFQEAQSYEKLPEGVEERLLRPLTTSLSSWGRHTTWPVNESIVRGKAQTQFIGTTGEIECSKPAGKISWDYLDKKSIPKKPTQKARKRCDSTVDMFGGDEVEAETSTSDAIDYSERVIYIAVEHWYYDGPGVVFAEFQAGIPWKSKMISFSTSVPGLTRSLNQWHHHRVAAAKLDFDSEADYKHASHVAIYAIRFEEGVFPKMLPHDGYTWFGDTAYACVKASVDAIHLAAQMHVSRDIMQGTRQASWVEKEQAEMWCKSEDAVNNPNAFGRFIGVGSFEPKKILDLDDSLDSDPKNVRCITCSL